MDDIIFGPFGQEIGSIGSPENKKIIDAFRSNDLEKLMEAHSSFKTMPWYKFLKIGVYRNLNPIQSNLLNLIVNAKVNQLWRKTDTNNEMFDLTFIQNLERELQYYGEALVKFDYVNDELKHTFITDNYGVSENAFGEVEQTDLILYYSEGMYDIKVEQTHIGNQEFNTIYYKEKGDKTKGNYTLGKYTDFEVTKNFLPERWNEHPMVFRFKNNVNGSDITTLLNEVDEHKSQINYIGRVGVPFRIEPVETRMQAMQDGTPDTSNISYTIANQYNGLLKNEYQSGDYQKPEFVQPDLQIDFYEKAIEACVKDSCRIFGISPISLGYEELSAKASGAALSERKELTIDTKLATRYKRLSELDKMFKEIGVDVQVVVNDIDDEYDPAKFEFFYNMFKNGDLSRDELYNVVFPYWNKVDKNSEVARLNKMKISGVLGG